MDTAHSEMPTVLMPIKANFAEAILNGTKKWELRRRAPRIETPFRVMLVVSGTDGQLWGEFICDKIYQLTPKEARAIIDECGITMRELYGYLRGSYHLNFIHVTEPKWYVGVEGEHQYPNIRQFGYVRTPQTWLYLKKRRVLKMGLTIRVKSSKATARPIDMGGGGFLRLRSRVAMLYGEPWASHYELLMEHPGISSDDSFFDDFNKKTEQLIREKKVSIKIVDFCLQSDIEGSIHYGACKEILKTIGDYDDNVCYGYAGLPSCAKFRDFKAILEDCVRLKCDMVWD